MRANLRLQELPGQRGVQFRQVSIGCFFVYNGILYVRCHDILDNIQSQVVANCFNLTRCQGGHFQKATFVQPAEADELNWRLTQ
jgi:hypothetical protein